jgi:hypothetical protein
MLNAIVLTANMMIVIMVCFNDKVAYNRHLGKVHLGEKVLHPLEKFLVCLNFVTNITFRNFQALTRINHFNL